MTTRFEALARSTVTVDAGVAEALWEGWRIALSQGGINTRPLPEPVVEAVRALEPRLIRIFIQEFFRIYGETGRYDWSRLDPYMDALAQTGANVVAAITIKPQALFPTIDATVWQPSDRRIWQEIIGALVHRYSVQRTIVTHWEIGNETDIGEDGGSPYLIPEPDAYAEFYGLTIEPILRTFPAARVGGPAACWIDNEPLPGFVDRCRADGTPLHFVSWHLYSDDPTRHALGVEKAKARIAGFGPDSPELMVTEWSCGFSPVSIEEQARDPRRSAIVAASAMGMLDAGLDWSFYYHIQDQTCYHNDFTPIFSERGVANMARHWNEIPHRFGLFGVGDDVRPHYFVFDMLRHLGDERLACSADSPDLRVASARSNDGISLMVINLPVAEPEDRIVTVSLHGLAPGIRQLTVSRIDDQQRWADAPPRLLPCERRIISCGDSFEFQVYAPAHNVLYIQLTVPAGVAD
jgi:hypothetical protein